MVVTPRSLGSARELTAFLDEVGLRWKQPDVSGPIAVFNCGPRADTTVYVVWQQVTGLLRASVPVVDDVPPARQPDVAAVTCAINAGLTVPGFVLDAGRVYWRAVTLLDGDGRVSSDVMGALLHMGGRVVGSYAARLRDAAAPDHDDGLSADSFLGAAFA